MDIIQIPFKTVQFGIISRHVLVDTPVSSKDTGEIMVCINFNPRESNFLHVFVTVA